MFIEKQLKDMSVIYEKQFSYNNYNGFDLLEIPYEVKLGEKKVLISAPHAVNHIRKNNIKLADLYTGSIASIVHLLTGCYCIYSNRISSEDPNYIIGGYYKEALSELCTKHNISLVIDLHGASKNREFDIDLGTDYGKSINVKKVEIIKQLFLQNNIRDVRLNDTFAASHEGTITSFTKKKLEIDAVQLEINSKFRMPNTNFNAYKNLIKSLIEIVNYFGSGDNNGIA